MRPVFVFCLCAAVLVARSASAAADDSPIQPERPGFTNGSDVVPVGLTQIEAGLAGSRASAADGGGWSTDGPQMLVRHGLTSKLEVRASLPDYFSHALTTTNFSAASSGSPTSGSGFGDAALGVKYKFFQSRDGNTKAAVTPLVSVPSGNTDFSTGHVDPALTLGVQTQSGARWNVQANLSAAYAWQETGRILSVSPSAETSYQLTKALAVYGDVTDSFARESLPTPVTDGGFTYLVNNNFQLDLETGAGLGGASSVRFFSGGVAFRF